MKVAGQYGIPVQTQFSGTEGERSERSERSQEPQLIIQTSLEVKNLGNETEIVNECNESGINTPNMTLIAHKSSVLKSEVWVNSP